MPHSTKSLYKMVEKSLDNSGDEGKVTIRNEVDNKMLMDHLYFIKTDENKALEVEPPSRKHVANLSHTHRIVNHRTDVNCSKVE